MTVMGYARVSTADQQTDGQLAALKAAGAATVFKEKVSRRRLRELGDCALQAGDLVIVTDRLRSMARANIPFYPSIPSSAFRCRLNQSMQHRR